MAFYGTRGLPPGPGEEARVVLHGQVPGAPLPQGGRPAPLPKVAGWQGRLVRHVLEDFGSVCPFLQILDLPVPHIGENVSDTLRILDLPVAEKVIEVPKISCSPCPSRVLVLVCVGVGLCWCWIQKSNKH